VPVRIHAEHGRDASDPHGLNRKHNLLRRLLVPFVDRYVPVSATWSAGCGVVVRIPRAKIELIKNGVDTEQIRARPPARIPIRPGRRTTS
jgi:hypothetical protein